MIKLKNMTIKRKLITISMVTSVGALLLAIASFLIWQWQNSKREMITTIFSHAGIIAENCKASLVFEDAEDAEETLKSLHIEPSIILACIYDKQNKVFATYSPDSNINNIQLSEIPVVETSGFTNDYLAVFKQIRLEEEKIGTIYLRANLDRIYESLVRNTTIGISITVVLVLITYFVSSRIQKLVSKPVLDLAEVAKLVSEKHDYSCRAVGYSNDELGLLIKAFNQMLDQIQQRDLALVEAKEQLEQRVRERTAELTSANTRLEKTNSELKDFVYIASHDLREPLRKISSFGMLLKESLEKTLTHDDKENFEFMIDGADRMNKMVEGLLVYSRLNTKEALCEVVDLNEIVQQLKDFELAELLKETNASVEISQVLPAVDINSVHVRQLLQNLIGNGIKYRKESVDPQITIRAKELTDGKVRIEVQDNGIGIDEVSHTQVFRMFKRLHSRDKYQGTGIGLAVCKKIVEKYGGQIGVESKSGEGSTFWFTLFSAKKAAVTNEI